MYTEDLNMGKLMQVLTQTHSFVFLHCYVC